MIREGENEIKVVFVIFCVFFVLCQCCIFMPACTVLLFYRNHFIDLYCHMFISTCLTLEFMSHRSRK